METPDIKYISGFVSSPDQLFDFLVKNVDWDERMKARKTASFGVSYNYSGITYPESAMPEELLTICSDINEKLGFTPNNCLMNYYLDGSSTMGFHSDSAEELAANTGVVIVSVGSERHITYRLIDNKDITHKYLLESGSLLYMSMEMQTKWMHAIKKEKGVGARISLTFRLIIK